MTELSKDVVEVTRADRKVAAALARGGFPGFQGNKIIATEIMGKLHDGYFLVQEIARHRLTSAATLQSQCDLYRVALERDATRFERCADMIADGFNVSGTLRAERTVQAKHYALEARAALSDTLETLA